MIKTVFLRMKPFGKQRPKFRATRFGGTVYTPDETVRHERFVRDEWNKQTDRYTFGEAPVSISADCYYAIPQSKTIRFKTAAMNGQVRPTVKPDASNVLKLLEDALNGVAYTDDSQIVDADVHKRYVRNENNTGYILMTITDEIGDALIDKQTHGRPQAPTTQERIAEATR